MRMMLKFTLPVEKGNQAFKDGSLGKTLELIMNKLKPEAAYFGPSDGKRCGMIFFDLAEPSQIVEVAEPLFSNLNAAVEIVPVMNGDDLRKGIAKTTKNDRAISLGPASRVGPFARSRKRKAQAIALPFRICSIRD